MPVYWRSIAAGSYLQNWRRVRPQRSVAVFHALIEAIEQGRIKPVRLDYRAKGTIDYRFTRVKTIDVARLCMEKGWQAKLLRLPTEELEGEPRENSLPTLPAAEPLAIGAAVPSEKPSFDEVREPDKKPFPDSRMPELVGFLTNFHRSQAASGGSCSENAALEAARSNFSERVNAALRAQENSLAAKREDDEHDREMEAWIEERRQKAVKAVEEMRAGGREAPGFAPKDNT